MFSDEFWLQHNFKISIFLDKTIFNVFKMFKNGQNCSKNFKIVQKTIKVFKIFQNCLEFLTPKKFENFLEPNRFKTGQFNRTAPKNLMEWRQILIEKHFGAFVLAPEASYLHEWL